MTEDNKKTIPAPNLTIKDPDGNEVFPLSTTQELDVDELETVVPPELRATMELDAAELQAVEPPKVPKKTEE